ncbi:UNVERIFIED_CONTAM: hypothetical protein Slati_3865500 [Sesamum latifolium]|uniref:Gag-pol polyprotein n=1 Tax=Sesamum latifolium TaxID=2727402 RepID=A0AAW2TL92_9LAMI
MSKNPLSMILETNKFNGTSYNVWLRNLRIIFDFENQGYVLNKPPPSALPEDSSPEEHLTFEKWHEDNRKVCNIILASMSKDIQKQYDRLGDVSSIMLRMSDVYAVPDRHIRYAATKAFFGTKLTEGSCIQTHGVKMLSLVEKLEDLKAGLDNDTQESRTLEEKKGKGEGQEYWERECLQLLSNQGMFVVEVNMITNSASYVLDTGCGAHICNDLQVLQRSRRLTKDEVILRLGNGKAVAVEP